MKQVPAFPYMNARLFRLVKYTLILIVPGEVKVDLTKFVVQKFLTKFLCTKDWKKSPIPAATFSESFWTSDRTRKNYVLTYSLLKKTFWHQFWCIFSKNPVAVWPCRPLLPLCFTVIIDLLRAGEVHPGSNPQSGAAQVNIPVGFQSWAMQCVGGGGFSVGLAL
jgi:hypothetical protein